MSDQNNSTKNPLAIASLVCGILSILTVCCCYGLPFNILGLGLGIVALVQSNKPDSQEHQDGKSFAIAGIATSLISIVITVLFIAIYGAAMLSQSNDFM